MAQQNSSHFAMRQGNRRGEWATACGRSVREKSLASLEHATWIRCPECRAAAIAARDGMAEAAAGDPDITVGVPTVDDHCACVHDGRGELTSECQEHQQIREQRDCLLAALKAIVETANDCPACDRGVLRHPENGHWPTCPFGHAEVVIAATEGK